MTDLRIADAPELTSAEVNDSLKIPTGGYGNYSITMITIRDWLLNYKMFATQSYVDTKVSIVTTALNNHTAGVDNPHQVTKAQVGLSNVDNTSDINKPISSATQTALTNLNTSLTSAISVKANAADVYTKSEVYTKVESEGKYQQKLSIDGVLAPTAVFDDVKNLDGVNGSPEPIINQPIQNLTNRTEFLKTHNNLTGRDSANAHPASSILSSNGSDQQEINDFGGSLWWAKPNGYNLGSTVKLTNGDVVRSTSANNTNNPNTNMIGWEFINKTYFIDSIADLRNFNPNRSVSIVYLRSYHLGQNQGMGYLIYDNTLSTFNDVFTFASNVVVGGWRRLESKDKVFASWGGVVDDTSASKVTENTTALQRVYDSIGNRVKVYLDVNTITINNVYVSKVQTITEGNGLTAVYVTSSSQWTFNEACEFHNLNIYGNHTTDTPVMKNVNPLKLQDGEMRLPADVDVTFNNVGFHGTVKYFVGIKGRGVECIECTCGSSITGAVFDLDFPTQAEIWYPPFGGQSQFSEVEAGFRGFKFSGFRNHASSAAIVRNVGYNMRQCWGIQFYNTWLEGNGRILDGYARNALVSGVTGQRMTAQTHLLNLVGFDGLTIDGLEINGLRNNIDSNMWRGLIKVTEASKTLNVKGHVGMWFGNLFEFDYAGTANSDNIDLSGLTYSDVKGKILQFTTNAPLRFFRASGSVLVPSSSYQPFTLTAKGGGATPTCTYFDVKTVTDGSTTAVHNFSNSLTAINVPRLGGYVGDGTIRSIYTGYRPKSVIVRNASGVQVGGWNLNLGGYLGGISITDTGFTIPAAINASGTNYVWEAD